MSGLLTGLATRIQDLVIGSSASSSAGFQLPTGPTVGTSTFYPANLQVIQHRKAVEKCYRQLETVVRLCRQPSLALKKSPPCILDALPEMATLMDSIFTADSNIMQKNPYLRLFIANVTEKCKQTIQLFREHGRELIDENSVARRSLTKKTLVFSHMHSELMAEFPQNGEFVGDRFRITKREAAEFWATSFGGRTIVPWEEFRRKLSAVHLIEVGTETHSLKSTIDLTCNDHVSNFEFDVFTRLFHPWSTLLKNWQLLATDHPAYMAFLTYEEVKLLLHPFINKPGTYVFRLSCTKLGQWAIGYVAPDRKIYQTIPQNKSLIQSLVDGSREGFYLYPNGHSKNVDLSHALQHNPEGRMKVTSEQYEIYCEMGTTFEMCKICDERNKNVKLEPCGHLLCRPCLNSWQESAEGGSTCPFCRCEIKGTESVIIDSYRPSSFPSSLLCGSDPKRRMGADNLMTFTESLPQLHLDEIAGRTIKMPPIPVPTFPPPSIPTRSTQAFEEILEAFDPLHTTRVSPEHSHTPDCPTAMGPQRTDNCLVDPPPQFDDFMAMEFARTSTDTPQIGDLQTRN